MKILLTNPINRSYVIMPSLGLGYLAALLTADGHEVRILNCIKERMTYDGFEQHIRAERYDVIGFQVYSYDLDSVRRHLESVRRASPDTVTIAGGPHPSGDPSGTLEYLHNLEFAFQGEAEDGLQKLMRQLADKEEDFSAIPGLVWRDGELIRVNPPQVVENLDDLPFPAWDLLRPEDYPEAPHGAFSKKFPTAPIIISRGCPCQCTFCSGANINARKVRRRSIDNVIAELKLLKERGIREFHIEDENFTLSRKYVLEFCKRLESEQLDLSWSLPSGIRLDTLDQDMLLAMERSGCYSLAVGIEFGTDRILSLTRKGTTVELIQRKLQLFKGIDIKVTGFFLLGIPGETREEMEQTARFARALPIDRAQFNIFMPLPGSEEWHKLVHQGQLKDTIDWSRFFVHDVAHVSGELSAKELKQIHRMAVLRFYLRPRILKGLLSEITSFRHLTYLIRRLTDTVR